jgi:hypothetical protein
VNVNSGPLTLDEDSHRIAIGNGRLSGRSPAHASAPKAAGRFAAKCFKTAEGPKPAEPTALARGRAYPRIGMGVDMWYKKPEMTIDPPIKSRAKL